MALSQKLNINMIGDLEDISSFLRQVYAIGNNYRHHTSYGTRNIGLDDADDILRDVILEEKELCANEKKNKLINIVVQSIKELRANYKKQIVFEKKNGIRRLVNGFKEFFGIIPEQNLEVKINSYLFNGPFKNKDLDLKFKYLKNGSYRLTLTLDSKNLTTKGKRYLELIRNRYNH